MAKLIKASFFNLWGVQDVSIEHEKDKAFIARSRGSNLEDKKVGSQKPNIGIAN